MFRIGADAMQDGVAHDALADLHGDRRQERLVFVEPQNRPVTEFQNPSSIWWM